MPDTEPLVLALDQGTTGSTALVLDRRGRVRGRGYEELPQHFPMPGWVEHERGGAGRALVERENERFGVRHGRPPRFLHDAARAHGNFST